MHKSIKGVRESGLKCDGFTTGVVRKAGNAPALGDAFTIEAWLAPQTYPWGWCLVVTQHNDCRAGYFFGIEAGGYVGMRLAVDGEWK